MASSATVCVVFSKMWKGTDLFPSKVEFASKSGYAVEAGCFWQPIDLPYADEASVILNCKDSDGARSRIERVHKAAI